MIDAAKGIGIVVSNNANILQFEGTDKIERPMPPLICIPTTAGSAADVSQFAIINDTARRTKIAIISKAIVPDLSIIDPDTLKTLDNYVLACTGIDTLTHAVEAYVSNASSEITDLHALEAIRLVSRYLVPALSDNEDSISRLQLMNACMFAGLAFSNASLGCVHALAHSLGGYLDLPHGECNALLLPEVIRFNYPSCPERYDTIARLLNVDTKSVTPLDRCNLLIDRIHALNTEVGIVGKLGQRGLSAEDIPLLVERAINDPCNATNPRTPTSPFLAEILEASI